MLTGLLPVRHRQRLPVRRLAGKHQLWMCVRAVMFAVVAASAAGCAVRVIQAYPGPARPSEEIAVLKPSGLPIDALDSVSIGAFGREADQHVLPGTHTIQTHFELGAYRGKYYQEVSFTAEAGHVYCLTAKLTTQGGALVSWEPVVFEQHQPPIWLVPAYRKRCDPASSGDMTFPDGHIAVRSPNGGEIWAIGSTHMITWHASGIVGSVMIEVSRDGGLSWAPVRRVVADGEWTHSWKVNGPATTQGRIRVTSRIDPKVAGTSEQSFVIRP